MKQEVPPNIQARVHRMAKRIAYRYYWTGDKAEMARDLAQEGLIGYLRSDETDARGLNRDIRRAMVDHLLKWLYGVTHRQSESLKAFTISLVDSERDKIAGCAAPPEEVAYVNQVVDIAMVKLEAACRVVKLSSYRAMIKAMIDNGDPYLTTEAGKDLEDRARSTASFMKKKIQHAFLEALAA